MSNRRRRCAVLAVVLLGAGGALPAQSRRGALEPLPIRTTITEAEAEGMTFPRGPAREHSPTAFAGRLPGTADRKCVDPLRVDLAFMPNQIRSGDFVIGGQIGGSMPPTGGHGSKVWWVPYHNPYEFSTTLLVRGVRIDHPSDTIRLVRPDYAWPVGGPKTDSFFPSGLFLPNPGRWLLVATAGDDWGCSILVAT